MIDSAPPAKAGSGGGENRGREILAFGEFEFRSDVRELRSRGVRVKLQIKPLQILEALLVQPGELVRRQELCQKLWPDGTFVDFESGLNTAVNRLRSALGDCAEKPRYVETVPRLGYRFICPVEKKTELRTSVTTNAAEEGSNILQPVLLKPEFYTATLDTKSSSAGWKIPFSSARLSRRRMAAAVGTGGLICGAVCLIFYGPHKGVNPEFHQLTFRSGTVLAARFVPGSRNIAYTAAWDGRKRQTDLLNMDDLSTRALNFNSGVLTAVSQKGDFGVISRDSKGKRTAGRWDLSSSGGSLKPLADSTEAVDWSPDGSELAIIRARATDSLVEFPLGRVVYSSWGWISNLRVSPDGKQVAFLEHPVRDDDGGYVRVVDKKGATCKLTHYWSSVMGLAWSRTGGEVWFTASKVGALRALYSVSTSGKVRLIANPPSSIRLMDISKEGRVLVVVEDTRMMMKAAFPQETREADLTKFDNSHADDISADGHVLLFTENAVTAGEHYTTYVYDSRSHKTFRLAEGRGLALSPDAKWAITIDPEDRRTLAVRRIPSGDVRLVSGGGFEYQWARFLPGGTDLLVGGGFPGKELMLARQTIGAKVNPIRGAPYMDRAVVSPDGSQVAGVSGGETKVLDLSSRAVHRLGPDQTFIPVAWSTDDGALYTLRIHDCGTHLGGVNLDNGAFERWRKISTSGIAGFAGLASIVAAPDAPAYAYSMHVELSRLYLVDGWR